MTIVAPQDGDITDPLWAQEITDAVNALVAQKEAQYQSWTPTLANMLHRRLPV
jgi:hypothetical protein